MSIVRRCLRPGSAWLTALLLLMAMVCASMGVAHAAETITYYYTSPQGTVLAKADASGNILSNADYRPYGTQVLGTPEQGPGYTGHVNDVDSGLVYMQARYYDPVTGRFLATDPAGITAGDPFSFNRFLYVHNNPISNTDPDGRQCAQCLYYGDSVEHQAQTNTGASEKGLAIVGAVGVAVAAYPAAAYVATTATAVAVDSIATGSLAAGLTLNTEAVVTSGAIVADGVAGANGAPSGFSDEALVARGGAAANQAAEKINAAIGPSRTPGVTGFSCQCDGGKNLASLGAYIPNKQMGVTTVGAIRSAGGDVIATPGTGNHVTLTGLTGSQASPLMMIEKNPNPRQ
ncbi:RHS repeat-associated core domain-containing protein [Luteibacter sp. 9135]|uniref:RHS repeat-associated core domain-containing protein n=1 Tax=Luteibacter sp. 9135 TaxID=1500893 RepID=UPI00163A6A3A|nr:RHS repeat-associated core domain-containing protein [Luteibacter sp. 9135]